MAEPKICPIFFANKTFPVCRGDVCAWWSNYAKECSLPLIADILADSSICQNVWNNPELLEGEG